MVDWFQKFIKRDLNTLDNGHPIRTYFDSYEKWRVDKFAAPQNRANQLPEEVIEFAGFIKGIQIFQNQLRGKVKRQFVNDLIDANICYGVLFEIKVLISCYIFEYENLHYRCIEIDGKHPDIMFTTESLTRVFLECTRKRAKPERIKNEILLIEDLGNSLKEKAESYKDLIVPLIYAVHVPEKIDLTRDQFRTDLGIQVQILFKDNIFKNVNWVIFSSYRRPFVEPADARGNEKYNTDLTNLKYQNTNVDPSLKADIRFESVRVNRSI
jgi:hypothetical protein